MRPFSVQQVVDVPISPTVPVQALTLPAGYRGYARVRFKGAAAGDFLYGKWVTTTSENLPQGAGSFTTANYGLLWADTNEKVWDFPAAGMTLLLLGSAAAGQAIVDAAGEIEDSKE